MKCFYHSADLDGKCAGAIVKMNHPEAELFGINYGESFPWDALADYPQEVVYMVDFHLQPFTDMARLADKCRLVWIDHHETAIKDLKEYVAKHGDFVPEGLRRVGTAGCELTWEYFHTHSALSMPAAVRLLGRYDVWDLRDPDVLPFQYGVRALGAFDPASELDAWARLFRLDADGVKQLVSQGRAILDYLAIENANYMRVCSFETRLDGLRVIAVNRALANSQLFDSVWDPDKYDAMVAFHMRAGGGWTLSLYTTKDEINVGSIARANGGGGHRKAAGYQCDVLPLALRYGR